MNEWMERVGNEFKRKEQSGFGKKEVLGRKQSASVECGSVLQCPKCV